MVMLVLHVRWWLGHTRDWLGGDGDVPSAQVDAAGDTMTTRTCQSWVARVCSHQSISCSQTFIIDRAGVWHTDEGQSCQCSQGCIATRVDVGWGWIDVCTMNALMKFFVLHWTYIRPFSHCETHHVVDGSCKLVLASSWVQLSQVLGVVCTDGQVSPQGAHEEQVQVEGRRVLSFGAVGEWQARQARHVGLCGLQLLQMLARLTGAVPTRAFLHKLHTHTMPTMCAPQ